MEETMRCFTLLLLVALLGGTDRGAAQETVETRGVTSVIKIDEVIFGHLTELNGKFDIHDKAVAGRDIRLRLLHRLMRRAPRPEAEAQQGCGRHRWHERR